MLTQRQECPIGFPIANAYWPEINSESYGVLVSAGHAGDVLDGKWYIAGGGNNSSACTDLLSLNLAGLDGTLVAETPSLQWESLAQSDPSASTATEGLSLSSISHVGLILAFGGYNGKYHNAAQVYRPGHTLPMLLLAEFPSTAEYISITELQLRFEAISEGNWSATPKISFGCNKSVVSVSLISKQGTKPNNYHEGHDMTLQIAYKGVRHFLLSHL